MTMLLPRALLLAATIAIFAYGNRAHAQPLDLPRPGLGTPLARHVLPPEHPRARVLPSMRNQPAVRRMEQRQVLRKRVRETVQQSTVPRPAGSPDIAVRAREGRSTLDPMRAGAFARSGPEAIGSSAVSRPLLEPRR